MNFSGIDVKTKPLLYIFSSFALAAALSSCGGDASGHGSDDEPQLPQTGKTVEIRATLPQGSRVSAEEDAVNRATHFKWEIGDEFAIYNTATNYSVFSVTAIDGDEAVLTGTLDVTDGTILHGVYPASAAKDGGGELTAQTGTLEGLGQHLVLTGCDTVAEGRQIRMMFDHECALMTFNLTFPEEVTSVSSFNLKNAASEYKYADFQTTSTASSDIAVAGDFRPDSDGALSLHLVLLPGSELNKFELTCETNDGTYSMPKMTSTNTTRAGVNHRTSRAMSYVNPYQTCALDPDGTETQIDGVRLRDGVLTWKADTDIPAGTHLSVCLSREWKCFHTLTEAESAARSLTMPDLNGGCTVNDSDPYVNDWIVALYMGANVASSMLTESDSSTQPLYWATGNLIAIMGDDGNARFRLSTLEELAFSQQTDSPLHKAPSMVDKVQPGDKWDLFCFGDPTGVVRSQDFKTTAGTISGKTKDIAHVQLGYNWRLPYSSNLMSSGVNPAEKVTTDEFCALVANVTHPSSGNVIYGGNTLQFSLSGYYFPSTFNEVGVGAYYLSGYASSSNTKGIVALYISNSTIHTATFETVGLTGPGLACVRPVTK